MFPLRPRYRRPTWAVLLPDHGSRLVLPGHRTPLQPGPPRMCMRKLQALPVERAGCQLDPGRNHGKRRTPGCRAPVIGSAWTDTVSILARSARKSSSTSWWRRAVRSDLMDRGARLPASRVRAPHPCQAALSARSSAGCPYAKGAWASVFRITEQGSAQLSEIFEGAERAEHR